MHDRTWALRKIRKLVHQLDENTGISDRHLASRMMRGSLVPRQLQGQVFRRSSRAFNDKGPDVIEHHLCVMFATYHELEREAISRPPRASPKPPSPRLRPEAQRSPLRSAGSVGPNLAPDQTECVPVELCPRGELFPLAPEQRHDTGTVREEDTVFLAASRRDPWANTCAGRGIHFSPEDQDSGEAMSE